ncbi:MAG: DUF4397 domain-containing protein [Planctomycetota bacterium]
MTDENRIAIVLASMSLLATGAFAQVRVIHASPDTPAVDVYAAPTPPGADPVNDDPAISGLEFTQDSGYIALPSDTYNFQVTLAGDTAAAINADAAIDENVPVSVVALGLSGGGSPAIFPGIFADDRTSSPGNAKFRIIHGSPDTPAVDVLANGGTIVDGLTFGNASDFSGESYIEVPAGRYDFEVRLDSTGDLGFAVNDFLARPGFNYTIIAVGLAGDGTLAPLPLVDIPAPGAVGVAGLGLIAATRRRRSG